MRAQGPRSALIACGKLVVTPVHGAAQPRAAGGVTIYDERNCPANANSPKVTVPFSFGVTRLEPFSTTQVYVTDNDSNPEPVHGPATITGDANGNVCLNILSTPAGTWKVDVVEQRSGFTDSKVFTIEELNPPPLPTTTPNPTPATTDDASTNRDRPERYDHYR